MTREPRMLEKISLIFVVWYFAFAPKWPVCRVIVDPVCPDSRDALAAFLTFVMVS